MCGGMPQRSDQHSVRWAPFERWTSRYDQWFNSEKGERIFRAEGQQGHPFYAPATFYTTSEIVGMCERAGFFLEDSRSCLLESPASIVTAYQPPENGIISGAGFVCMRFKRVNAHQEHEQEANN